MESTKMTERNIDVQRYMDALLYNISLDKYSPPDHTVISLACTVCKKLMEAGRWAEIDSLFEGVFAGFIEHYREIELLLRVEIMNAKTKGNYQHACHLIEIGPFRDGSDLIGVWDECIVEIQKKNLKRPLTSVSKYRIRERFPPPKSICPSGYRIKHSLSTSQRATLMNHFQNVTKFPKKEQKMELVDKTGLTKTQIHNWFSNRRRSLNRRLPDERAPPRNANPTQNGCNGSENPHAATQSTNPLTMLYNAAEFAASLDNKLTSSHQSHAPNITLHTAPAATDTSHLQLGSSAHCNVGGHTAPNGRECPHYVTNGREFPHYVTNYYRGEYSQSHYQGEYRQTYYREGGYDYYRPNDWVPTYY
nr:homeobox protein SIX6-like [Lytechinus pictus]